MSADALWVGAGLVLCGAELLAPGVFLLWVGLACCGAGLLTALFGLGGQGQIAAFVLLAIVSTGLAALRSRRPLTRDTINTPSAGLIGANCTALAFQAGEGRVRLRDGQWSARMAAAPDPAIGETLRVIGLEGTTLLVARLP